MSGKYFSEDEMRCKCGCGKVMVHPDLWRLMDYVREEVGHALIVDSGYRCANHPEEKKKPTPGEHTYGTAVDLQCNNSERFTICFAAKSMGCDRIGIGKGFIHLGLSRLLPQKVMWDYYNE